MLVALALVLSHPVALDGDTVKASGERYRLLGIDAPELPGHCRRGRTCAPGDPYASKRALAAFMRGRRVTWEAVTRDRYGRSVGVLRAGGKNASCAMLAAGRARYVARWDTGGLVRKECGL